MRFSQIRNELFLRACSWEGKRSPKPPNGVRILALVLKEGRRIQGGGRSEGDRLRPASCALRPGNADVARLRKAPVP